MRRRQIFTARTPRDHDGLPTSRLLRGWLPRLAVPALIVGLAFAGVATPAFADDQPPATDGTTASAATASADPAAADTTSGGAAAGDPGATPPSDPQPSADPAPSADPQPSADPAPAPAPAVPDASAAGDSATAPTRSAEPGTSPSDPPASAPAAVPAAAAPSVQALTTYGKSGTKGGGGDYGGTGTLTIVKQIVDAHGNVIDATPAGWTFTATSSGLPDGSQSMTTDDTGSVAFTVTTSGSSTKVSVVEEQQSGYQLVKTHKLNAVCTGAKGSASNDGRLGFSISLKSGQDVRCVVVNRLEPPCITVSKTSDPASGSVVAPGSIISYTLTATVEGGSLPASLTLTDDLSAVLDHATVVGALTPSQGTAVLDGTNLLWTITAFDKPLTLTYSVRVDADAFGVQLTNVLIVPPNASCDGSCTTEHSTPCWTLTKSSDPVSGSSVLPGSTIVYTLTAANGSSVDLAGATATDDLSGVLDNASLITPLPPGLTLDAGGTSLAWAIPTMPAHSSVTVSFSVTVDADASDAVIHNVATPGPGGECTTRHGDGSKPYGCETTHHVPTVTHHAPTVDLGIVKTHTTDDGGFVDSGKGELITYTMTVSNLGASAATGVIVSDPLPAGLTFVAGSGSGPAGWTVSSAGSTVSAHFAGSFAPQDTAVLTFQAVVGALSRSGPTVPFPDVDNKACVSSTEVDTNPADNCSTDVTHVKSIAVSTQALCVNDAPVVSYSVAPHHVTGTPTIALIWWTSAAYAGRDPSIPAGDQAALLADGASQVNYIAVPAGWVDGQAITGTQLWPGAGVDATGRGNAWPGWRQLSDGTWVLDPAAPFYDLRNGAIVEVRINPTTASTVAYPPPSTHCDPATTTTTTTSSTGGSELASTGSDTTGPLTAGGLLLGLGAALLILVRRRRQGRTE